MLLHTLSRRQLKVAVGRVDLDFRCGDDARASNKQEEGEVMHGEGKIGNLLFEDSSFFRIGLVISSLLADA